MFANSASIADLRAQKGVPVLLIDKLSAQPVYEQLVCGIERHILLGVYPPGTMLPSLRELSVSLNINPNTIQKSYADLTRRGIICPSPGSGSYVSPDAPMRLREEALKQLDDFKESLARLLMAGIKPDEIRQAVEEVCAPPPATQKGDLQ